MTLLAVLVMVLMYAIEECASSGTARYFVHDLMAGKPDDADDDWRPDKITDIAKTFIELLSKQSLNSLIHVDGEMYHVSDYRFPETWWQLAQAKEVYASRGAVALCQPMFKVTPVNVGSLLSPSAVQRFFLNFNDRQKEGDFIFKLGPAPANFGDVAVLTNLRAVVTEDGKMLEVNDQGSIDDLVTQVLGVESCYDLDEDCCKLYMPASERTVREWLAPASSVKLSAKQGQTTRESHE